MPVSRCVIVTVSDRYRHTREARSAFIRHRPQNCPRCVLTIRQSPAQQDHSKDTPTNCSSPYLQHLSPFRRVRLSIKRRRF